MLRVARQPRDAEFDAGVRSPLQSRPRHASMRPWVHTHRSEFCAFLPKRQGPPASASTENCSSLSRVSPAFTRTSVQGRLTASFASRTSLQEALGETDAYPQPRCTRQTHHPRREDHPVRSRPGRDPVGLCPGSVSVARALFSALRHALGLRGWRYGRRLLTDDHPVTCALPGAAARHALPGHPDRLTWPPVRTGSGSSRRADRRTASARGRAPVRRKARRRREKIRSVSFRERSSDDFRYRSATGKLGGTSSLMP